MKKITLAILLLATPAFAADDTPPAKAEATGKPTPITPKAPEKPKATCGKDAEACQKVVDSFATQSNKWQAAAHRYRDLLLGMEDKVAQDAIDATN